MIPFGKGILFFMILVLAQGVAFGASLPTPSIPKVLPNTPMNRLTIRLRQQNIQIQRDEKAGRLTKAQAKSLHMPVAKRMVCNGYGGYLVTP